MKYTSLDKDNQNLHIYCNNTVFNTIVAIYIIFWAFAIAFENFILYTILGLLSPLVLIIRGKPSVNVKYGDNKATLNIQRKNYDIFVSQVSRIEYSHLSQNDRSSDHVKNRIPKFAYGMTIYYNSNGSDEKLTLQTQYLPGFAIPDFESCEFDYLFKFLTSKNGGGKIIGCHEKNHQILTELSQLENSDDFFSCSAESYQYNGAFPVNFVGEMTASFLNDRIIIQIPNNCFIAYYRDIKFVNFENGCFVLNYTDGRNLKIKLTESDYIRNIAINLVENIENKINEYQTN